MVNRRFYGRPVYDSDILVKIVQYLVYGYTQLFTSVIAGDRQ
jgi:hypothetical protein